MKKQITPAKCLTAFALAITALAIAYCVSGCRTAQTTPESVQSAATSIGYAAGIVADQNLMDDATRSAIVEAVTRVEACVPTNGQPLVEAWTPIVRASLDGLVSDGTLTPAKADLAFAVSTFAARELDLLLSRHQTASDYVDIAEAAVRGFANGFLAAFRPVNGIRASSEALIPVSPDLVSRLRKDLSAARRVRFYRQTVPADRPSCSRSRCVCSPCVCDPCASKKGTRACSR